MKRRKQSHMVLGIFLLGGLAILTTLTFRLAGISVFPRANWTVRFGPDAQIQEGVEVLSSGTKVGNVKEVHLGSERDMMEGSYVTAVLSVESSVTLWEGAEVILRPRALLGGFVVVLERGRPGAKTLSDDQPLRGRVEAGVMDELTLLVRENRESIRRFTTSVADVSERLDRGEGSLGALLREDEIYDNLKTASRNIAELTEALNSETSALGRLAREPEIYDELRAGVRSLRQIADQVNSGKGALGTLLRDEELGASLKDAVRDVRDIVAGLRRGEGAVGLLLRDETVRGDLAAGIRSLGSFAQRLEASDGTLSRLMSDPEVYENLRVVSHNLRAISEDVSAGKGNIGLLLKDDVLYREAQRFFESLRESTEIARENAPLVSLVSFTSLFFNVLN
jgi:ABC-type transporter Mla subunit MlaD